MPSVRSLRTSDSPAKVCCRTNLKKLGYRLLELKWTYPSGPFPAAIDQALRFGLFDLGRLEALILKHVAGDFFNLDGERDQDA